MMMLLTWALTSLVSFSFWTAVVIAVGRLLK
jgi:hypothetical protein